MPLKESTIKIKVSMDENRIPETLHWTSEEGGIEDQEAKVVFLSLWDGISKESLRIDLWTKDMPLKEMKMFFYETLLSMSDTFMKATDDEKMTDTLRDFCDYFAEKMEIKKK